MALAERTAVSGEQTSGTTFHTCSLPSGFAEGDLLVLLFANESGSDNVTTPSGWALSQKGVNGSGGGYVYMWTKTAAAGDVMSAFVDVSSGSAERSAYISLGFSDAQLESSETASNGTGTSISHSGYTDPGETAIYCTFAIWGDGQASPTVSSYATDHTNTNIAELQSDIALGACTTPSRGSVPSSVTITQGTAGIYRCSGFVVTEDSGSTGYSLEAGSFSVTANDITTDDLQAGSLSVTAPALIVNPITLETGVFTVQAETQLGTLRMTAGEIQRLDWSAGLYPLTILPPKSLTRGDSFGVILTEDAASAVTFDAERFETYHNAGSLSSAGDFVMWRYDGAKLFISQKTT